CGGGAGRLRCSLAVAEHEDASAVAEVLQKHFGGGLIMRHAARREFAVAPGGSKTLGDTTNGLAQSGECPLESRGIRIGKKMSGLAVGCCRAHRHLPQFRGDAFRNSPPVRCNMVFGMPHCNATTNVRRCNIQLLHVSAAPHGAAELPLRWTLRR